MRELHDVFFVPHLSKNLVSVGQALEAGFTFVFAPNKCTLFDQSRQLVATCHRFGRLFVLGTSPIFHERDVLHQPEVGSLTHPNASFSSSVSSPSSNLWHFRLGHVGAQRMRALLQHDYVVGFPLKSVADLTFCPSCALGKQQRKKFPIGSHRSPEPLGLIHTDLLGPMQTPSLQGSLYQVTFIDDYTRYGWMYYLSAKSDTFSIFCSWQSEVETQSNRKVKILRSDGGGEFNNAAFNHHCLSHGIIRQITIPHTPEQNKVAERRHRTQVEMGRSMLKHASLSNHFWAEALNTANYLLNRLPTKAVEGLTPYEAWSHRKPNLSHLRIFGCEAYVHVPKALRRKLDSKSQVGILLGYGETVKAYRIYLKDSQRLVFARDVIFNEQPLLTSPVIVKASSSSDVFSPDSTPGEDLSFSALGEDEWELPSPSQAPEPAAVAQLPTPPVVPVLPAPIPPAAAMLPPPPLPIAAAPATPPIAQPPDPVLPSSSDPTGDQDELDFPFPAEDVTHPPNLPLPVEEPPALRHSTRIRQPSWKVRDNLEQASFTSNFIHSPQEVQITSSSHLSASPTTRAVLTYAEALMASPDIQEPSSYKEAMSGPQASEWKKAVDDEFQSLKDNKTWRLCELPEGRTAVGSKWTFKIKYTADGAIERYKARLVAQGYTQRAGADYDADYLYSPVVQISSLRTILALATIHDWEVVQLDVKTAFLYGHLKEEIYMHQPEAYEEKGKEHLVCLLLGSIYGLKQSAINWNHLMNEVLIEFGFVKCPSDGNVYVLRSGTALVILALYVDDCILASNDKLGLLAKTITMLKSRFRMADLGDIHYCIGMKVTQNRIDRWLHLSQTQYIKNTLTKFNMIECKPASTPLAVGAYLSAEQAPKDDEERKYMESIPYQEAVGRINWIRTTLRPDLSHAVRVLAQQMANPGPAHWSALKRTLRYLKGTMTHGLLYSGPADKVPHNPQLFAYTDADWGGDVDSKKSTSGFALMLCNAAIDWGSKRQTAIALSSTESEYMAATLATKRVVDRVRLLEELGTTQVKPVIIKIDNQSALALAGNPKFSSRSKHIDLQYHYVREKCATGEIKLEYCPTKHMAADILTKSLPKDKHLACMKLLGVHPVVFPSA